MKLRDQIQQLEEKGYRVKIFHYRYFDNGKGEPSKEVHSGVGMRRLKQDLNLGFYPRGGKTIVGIFRGGERSFELIAGGTANCSLRDNYSKKIGTQIALGRALKEMK